MATEHNQEQQSEIKTLIIKGKEQGYLTYAEVKAIASGNPMVIEKASIDAEVARLSRLRDAAAPLKLTTSSRKVL